MIVWSSDIATGMQGDCFSYQFLGSQSCGLRFRRVISVVESHAQIEWLVRFPDTMVTQRISDGHNRAK